MKLKLKELAVFAVLGAFMFISKLVMDALPNIHLLATLTGAYTLVFRKKAIFPIAVFVFLTGLFSGFSMWWVPHLYLWLILWGVFLALPKFEDRVSATITYMVVCGLHGLLYGTMYAPWQMLWMGLDFDATLAWIAAGLPFDITHAVSNFFCGLLIIPLSRALNRVK